MTLGINHELLTQDSSYEKAFGNGTVVMIM
jgi:hypothetical protein